VFLKYLYQNRGKAYIGINIQHVAHFYTYVGCTRTQAKHYFLKNLDILYCNLYWQ